MVCMGNLRYTPAAREACKAVKLVGLSGTFRCKRCFSWRLASCAMILDNDTTHSDVLLISMKKRPVA